MFAMLMLTAFMMLMLMMFMLIMLVCMKLSLMAIQFFCGYLFFNDLSATYNKL
jgi:hypothetical protein